VRELKPDRAHRHLDPQVRVDARHIPLAGTRKPQDRPLDRSAACRKSRSRRARLHPEKLEETAGNVTRTANC